MKQFDGQPLEWEVDSMGDHVVNDRYGNILAWVTPAFEVFVNNQQITSTTSLAEAKKAAQAELFDLAMSIILFNEGVV